MPETLELPTGETVTPGDVFLYNGYPSRFVPVEDDGTAFLVAPLYWGDSGMDVPFRDHEAFRDQWGPDSEGTLSADEWRAWLRDARADDRFGDEEIDALARELLPGDDAGDDTGDDAGDDDTRTEGVVPGRDGDLLDRLRRALDL